MREIVARARELFVEGLPLSAMVDRRLALDIDLFSRGGMRVLDKIAEQDYDVLARAAGHLEGGARLVAARFARAAWPSRGRPDDRARRILRPLPAGGAHAAHAISTTRSCSYRGRSATPCAPFTRSCAIATI